MLKVGDLIPIVAGLLDDPDQDFATDKYLLPKFQAAQNLLVSTMLENPNIGDIKAVVQMSGVAAGTKSLRAFGSFNDGKPLSNLKDIITLEEKVAGMGEQEFAYLTRVLKLPNVVPASTNQLYSWTSEDILLLGATSDLDFRVYGTFEPAALVSGESVLVPGTAAILQYRTAEIVAAIRGNQSLSLKYKNDADNAQDSHLNYLIMYQQGIPIRHRAYPRTGYELRSI